MDARLSKEDIATLSRMFGPPDLHFMPHGKAFAQVYERLLAHGLVEADLFSKPHTKGCARGYRRTKLGEAFLDALGVPK